MRALIVALAMDQKNTSRHRPSLNRRRWLEFPFRDEDSEVVAWIFEIRSTFWFDCIGRQADREVQPPVRPFEVQAEHELAEKFFRVDLFVFGPFVAAAQKVAVSGQGKQQAGRADNGAGVEVAFSRGLT